jgi:Niemann-Pick C1 protein
LPALTLDKKRVKSNRYDVFCCFKQQGEPTQPRDDIVRKYFNKHFVPFVFKKITKVLTIFITLMLIIIGCMSTQKILRGLNQNVSFVSNSPLYDYFEALYTYGDAGPPAYVIFNNVNYTNPENLGNMSDISAELAQFNDTIIAPIYSWVGPF